jgi:hypothetical protein
MKILIGTNVLTSVHHLAYASHCQFWYRLGKKHPEVQFYFMPPGRMSIDNMRNAAAKVALELECDYLMFIDDDMLLHPETFESLLKADKDIVMALTFIRGGDFPPMFFKRVQKDGGYDLTHYLDWQDNIDKDGLVEAAAIGFATVLIKTHLLKKLEPPYFLTAGGHTEDVYFCCRVKAEIGEQVGIFVDTKVPTGHILEPEIAHVTTVEKLREYHKKEVKAVTVDRGQEYLEKCFPDAN